MVTTGFLTSFPALVITQMVWGLGWTFSSGAEVAWLTDELDQPDRVAGVLTASPAGSRSAPPAAWSGSVRSPGQPPSAWQSSSQGSRC